MHVVYVVMLGLQTEDGAPDGGGTPVQAFRAEQDARAFIDDRKRVLSQQSPWMTKRACYYVLQMDVR